MKLILADTKLFKQSIDAMVDLIKDAEFVVNEYGISLKAIDAAQIAMVMYKLPRDVFETFEVSETKKLGLNLPSLSGIMKRARADDKLILELNNQNRLKITFEGKNTRSFSINLLDLSSSELPNPNIDAEALIKIDSNVLLDGVKDASLFATYLAFKVNELQFEISASGPQGELHNITKLNSPVIKEKDVKKEALAMFSIEYLQHILKGVNVDDPVELNIKTNSPLKVKYNIGEAIIQFYLAPRDFD